MRIFLLILMVLSLTSCTQQTPQQSASDLSPSSEIISSLQTVVNPQGYSFADLEIELDLSKFKPFEDPHLTIPKENQIQLLGGSDHESMGGWSDKTNDTLNGNFNYFCVVTGGIDGRLDVTYVPLMLLQTFKKPEITESFNIAVDGKNFSLENMDKWKVFENDELVIFDFRYVITGLSLDDYLKKIALDDEKVAADYFDWTVEIYDYFTSNDNFNVADKS